MSRNLYMLIVAALMAACSPAPDSGAETVTELVYATPYSPTHPFSRADQRWMDFVAERSGGTLRIRPSWSGALLSAEHSMVELRHGVVDIGLITPIYVKGGAHLIRIQSGFYSGTTSIEEQVALYRCLEAHEPQIGRELAGLVVLAVQGGNPPGIITRDKPVRALADLRGLRIRVPTELLPVLKALGADPVNMPMGEVYSAMAKGVIEGVVAPADTFKSLHFAEVSHFYTHLLIPRGAYPARAMGEVRWQRLSEAHRQVLREATAVWEQALAEENRRALEEGRELARDEGVVEFEVDAEDERQFAELYLRDAERGAAGLARYGIDGMSAYRRARAAIGPDGHVVCTENAR